MADTATAPKKKWVFPSFLNEPFMLWLLSSVVIGLVSWQYNETQRISEERQIEEQVLRRARLELKLLLQDAQTVTLLPRDSLSVGHLDAMILRLQYNASSPLNQSYYPSALNVMLEIDSRTASCGLELFQDRMYEEVVILSHLRNNKLYGFAPGMRIAHLLTDPDKEVLDTTLGRLLELITELLQYYSAEKPGCDRASSSDPTRGIAESCGSAIRSGSVPDLSSVGEWYSFSDQGDEVRCGDPSPAFLCHVEQLEGHQQGLGA